MYNQQDPNCKKMYIQHKFFENWPHSLQNGSKHDFRRFFMNKMSFRSLWIFLCPKWAYHQIFGRLLKIRGKSEKRVFFQVRNRKIVFDYPQDTDFSRKMSKSTYIDINYVIFWNFCKKIKIWKKSKPQDVKFQLFNDLFTKFAQECNFPPIFSISLYTYAHIFLILLWTDKKKLCNQLLGSYGCVSCIGN